MKVFVPALGLCAWLLASSGALAQTEVALRLEANPEAPVIARVPSDDPRLVGAASAGVAGWQTVNFDSIFNGWVERRSIRKDLTVLPGAPIYLRESPQSPILTTVQAGSRVDLLQVGEMGQVRYTGPAPVFFQPPPPPVAPVVATVPPPTTTTTDPPPPTTPPPPRQHPTPIAARPSGGPTYEYFDGILQVTPAGLLGPGSRHRLQLVDGGGRRIAFLDVEKVLVNTPLANLMGRPVQVYGTRRALSPGSTANTELVISARVVRLRQP